MCRVTELCRKSHLLIKTPLPSLMHGAQQIAAASVRLELCIKTHRHLSQHTDRCNRLVWTAGAYWLVFSCTSWSGESRVRWGCQGRGASHADLSVCGNFEHTRCMSRCRTTPSVGRRHRCCPASFCARWRDLSIRDAMDRLSTSHHHFLWLSSEANSRADTLWRSGCKRQL